MNESIPKNSSDIKELELMIIASGMTLEEFIFERLDMGWPDLFYDVHHRIVERRSYFEDLE